MKLEQECRTLIGAAIEVHRALGPGLLESLYSQCLAIELGERGMHVRREVPIPIVYRGLKIEPAYRIDLLVAEQIIVEVKSVLRLEPVFKAQLLTYLRLTNLHVGFLLNFNNAVLKDGITRMVR
jgi:GxxExxY protein